MKTEKIKIENVPAIIYGEKSKKVFLFVHGQSGYKEEAEDFANFAVPKGYQVLGIDLPEHGERKGEKDSFYPWVSVPELKVVMNFIKKRWQNYSLRANSIGAWFSMLAFFDENFDKCLFVSPILDMEKLIFGMMKMAGVSEEELKEKKEIKTDFGQTLSLKYLNFASENKIKNWNFDTKILYAENDNLTAIETVNEFAKKIGAEVTIMKNGEHWFHTKSQVEFLNNWTEKSI